MVVMVAGGLLIAYQKIILKILLSEAIFFMLERRLWWLLPGNRIHRKYTGNRSRHIRFACVWFRWVLQTLQFYAFYPFWSESPYSTDKNRYINIFLSAEKALSARSLRLPLRRGTTDGCVKHGAEILGIAESAMICGFCDGTAVHQHVFGLRNAKMGQILQRRHRIGQSKQSPEMRLA